MPAKTIEKLLTGILAPLIAFCAVTLEPSLSSLARGRAAALPLLVLLIGASLLHTRTRSQIIIVLCYGVTFLAVRDAFLVNRWHLPINLEPDLAETLILIALLLVAALSAIAAVGETLQPGAVWARRCYFGAAALYFTGLGINSYGRHGSWQAVVLCVTGGTAVFGCLFAHRIVASERMEEVKTEISDEAEQRLRDAQHVRAVRDKEWQDPTRTERR